MRRISSLTTGLRQIARFAKNLLRMDRQDSALDQHDRVATLPPILLCEDACLCASFGLVSVLYRVDFGLPAGSLGVG